MLKVFPTINVKQPVGQILKKTALAAAATATLALGGTSCSKQDKFCDFRIASLGDVKMEEGVSFEVNERLYIAHDGKVMCYHKPSRTLDRNCSNAHIYSYQAALIKSVAQANDENNDVLTLSKKDIKRARKHRDDLRGRIKKTQYFYGYDYTLRIFDSWKGLNFSAGQNSYDLFHYTPNLELRYDNEDIDKAIKRARKNYTKYNKK